MLFQLMAIGYKSITSDLNTSVEVTTLSPDTDNIPMMDHQRRNTTYHGYLVVAKGTQETLGFHPA